MFVPIHNIAPDKDKILSVDYNSIIPFLTKDNQEQQQQINEQNQQINKQQLQIDELKKIIQELINKK